MLEGTKLFDLTGRVALVTGATHGLGMAMAAALGKAGATVTICGRSQERIDNALAQYAEMGLNVRGYVCNVTHEDEAIRLVNTIRQEVGIIDILVNNAGIIKRIPSQNMSVSEFEEVITTDLTSPFIMSKAVFEGMRERGSGKIINVCSMMSELARDTVTAYAAAKGGLKMLTKNMATEWARYNIQVNGIGPGYFATAQTAPIRVDGHPFNEFIIKRTPAGRWGNPEDLGGTIIFLASPASDFVTGQVVYVDGGILACLGKAAHEE